MPRSDSKAAQILSDARKRLDVAEREVTDAQSVLDVAVARLEAHTQAYDALAEAFAVKPRKTATKKPAAVPVTASEKPDRCGICGNPRDHADHDPTYLSSHPFDEGKPARAKRKPKEAHTLSVPAAGDEAIAAGASGD